MGATVFGCAEELDQTREARPKSTLGEDIYSVLCDRVGASSLSEDLEGQSYRSICHKTSKGFTGTTVKRSLLPAVATLPKSGGEGQSGGACRAGDRPCDGTLQCVRDVCAPGSYARRELGVAKIEALARHRDELIQAFDATFPEQQIDDPFYPGKKVRLIDALDTLMKRMTSLYDLKDPKDPTSALVPASTDALARLFDGIGRDPAAQAALSRMGNRQGYKPLPVALGTMRPMFLYPRFRELSRLLISRLGPGGALEPQLQEVLGALREELRTLAADPKEPPLAVDAAKAQPSRPRQKIEFVSALLLDERDAYAQLGATPRWMVARDRRGFALPAGVSPGSVPAPFVADADGLPAVDAAGRFVGADGAPLAFAPPFASPGFAFDPKFTFDASGRAVDGSSLLYQYRDTSRTMVGSLMVDMRPLLAPRSGLDVGDSSTLMKALAGAFVLYGPEKTGTRSYPLPDGKEVALSFTGFDAEQSPFVDLMHATGAFFAAPGSDDYLGSTLTLHEQRPEITGETLALAWRIWFESKKPEYASAKLDDASTLWDEIAIWLAKVARVDKSRYIGGPQNPNPRGLLADVTLAMADPAAVEWLPKAYAPTMRNRDRISYNPADVNGAPLNQETKLPVSSSGWKTPVDRSAPDAGFNRSGLQRFLGVIAAANKVKACNKPGTKVISTLKIDCPILPAIGVDLTYPLGGGTIAECDLFEIPDIGVFFVDSILDASHPRRAKLLVKDSTLTGLLGVVDGIIPDACGKLDLDTVLQVSTGLAGLRTVPTPQALSRLLFFGAESKTFGSNLPDIDPQLNGKNKPLNTFISNSLEPVATNKCPKNSNGVNTCAKFSDTLRGVGMSTFFATETPWLPKHPAGCKGPDCDSPSSGFYEGMRPLLSAFANYGYDPDPGESCAKTSNGKCAGEQLFLDLLVILDKHWSSGTTTKLVAYEDFLAWVFADSGLLTTGARLVGAMRDTPYTSLRVRPGQPRDGLDVTRDLIAFLFDQEVSKQLGVVDRAGKSTTTWNDGTTPKQVTPYDLFVKALRGMDARMDSLGDGGAKKAVWRSARSELVDQFLLAEGTSWKNPAISAALPVLGRLVREQVNARCPDREKWYANPSVKPKCDWADKTFTESFAKTVDGPLFGTINRLQESLRADDEMRVELQLLLDYLMQQEMSPDAVTTTVTAMSDLLQVFHDDEDLAPVMNAISVAASPGQVDGKKTAQPGAAHATVALLQALLDDSGGAAKTIDRYHVLDPILRNLVTPMGDGRRSPLEVLIDVTTDVHRYDSAALANLAADDWAKVSSGVEGFLADDYRGLHQFYTIIRGRKGE